MVATRLVSSLALAGLALAPARVPAADLTVPGDYPTIQAAVAAAPPGATIRVGPGTWRENVVIARSLTLVSAQGPGSTVLDGGRLGPVVRVRGTARDTVTVAGFTISNGWNTFSSSTSPTPGRGGGVHVQAVQATLADNVITGNIACAGAGIAAEDAAVTIVRNRIRDNVQDPACREGHGGAVYVHGGGAAASRIEDNTISGHRIGGDGGAIAVNWVARITIAGNVLSGNQTAGGTGGALFVDNSGASVRRNTFVDNLAVGPQAAGGAMTIVASDPAAKVEVSENVLRGNGADVGSAAMLLAYHPHALQFTRNAVVGPSAGPLLRCETPQARVHHNLLANGTGPALSGYCAAE